MPRRARRSDDPNYMGCLVAVVLMAAFPVIVALIEGGVAFVVGNWPIIIAGIAIAIGLVVAFVTRRFWWRRSRRVPPLRADLLSILTLSPYGFENFCRDLLEREGFQAVTTKQTGDQGVDVELRARDGRIGVAQCKQVPHNKIGRPTVQQLYGEMISRGATFAYVITTGGFTDEAAAFARTKTITLVDRDALLEMAGRHLRA